MAVTNQKEKKKMNPFLWFLFAIVIPVIMAITLILIILTVAGVDVLGWAKETGNSIPVVSNVIETDKEKDEQRSEEKLKDTIASKDEEIAALNQQISNLESTIDGMEQEIARLENNEAAADDTASENGKEGTSRTDSIQTISSSFTEMDNEQAAQILQNMEQDLTISILENLPNDVRGEIFEAMEPELAAELTQQFVNRTD
ncbi:MotE family protein [Lentibacillus sp.]|uniref:MotE family protein n=1 Tax=Lentibacillus sp. TaxID=1925746 RepID=UPI002B4ACD6F|nr:hypothetical protein [Lentibacillus sp.]HLS07992.1 hypothetical protein [Lentibacillus sp.]